MLSKLATISLISQIIFSSFLISFSFSADDQFADSSAFQWRAISFPFDDRIGQAVLFDSANGWALSIKEPRRLYRLQNGNWQAELPPADIDFHAIFGFSADNLWLVCFNKKSYRYFLRHLDRGTITDYYTPNADPIAQLDLLAPNNIWAVCQWGQIMHFDGTRWELIPCPAITHIISISMVNDSCGWAGGEYRGDGVLLFWDGKTWNIKAKLKCSLKNNFTFF